LRPAAASHARSDEKSDGDFVLNAVEVAGLQHRYPSYDKKPAAAANALDGVSLEVANGEFFVLLGPSGCGKTTLLRCIAGLERPTGGTIRLAGATVVSPDTFVQTNRRSIGMVFQDYAIWPHMTVFQNVAFPLAVGRRMPKSEMRRRVLETLEKVNLAHLAERDATQLSGGQQQRVSLARALVREPAVLLLDEPLSNLDAALRERMRTELRRIQGSFGITSILVTHDQVEALSMGTRIALMSNGKVEQLGSPRDLYERPQSRFAAEFIGIASFYEGTIAETKVDGDADRYVIETGLGMITARSRQARAKGETATLGFRPEHVVVRADGPISNLNEFTGVVRSAVYVGNGVDLHIEAGGGLLRATVASNAGPFGVGDRVRVELPAAYAVVVAS
jgi:iron(III) transport system ATP-binding protein